MVVVLTGLGLSAQTAVDAAMKALPIFETILFDPNVNVDFPLKNIIAIFSSGRSEHFRYSHEATYGTENGACILVNAITIADFVTDQLLELQPPAVLAPADLEEIANQAAAEGVEGSS